MASRSEKVPLSAITGIPQWFGLLFAFVYICGYLIDFFFYSSKGIIDSGGELLKLRYVHIGLAFVIFVMLVAAPAFFVFFGRSTINAESTPKTPFLPINDWLIWTAILWWWSVFFSTMFAPPLYFNRTEHAYRYWCLLGIALTFVLYIIIIKMKWFERNHKNFERNRTWLGQGIFALILLLDLAVVPGLWPTFREMFPNLLFFLGFCFGIAGLFGRAYEILSQAQEWNLRAAMFTMLSGCTLVLLTFVTLLAYAYVVFPFIPNVKGGADYTEAHRLKVTLMPGAAEPLNDVILLYSTSASFFFAPPEKGNDACQWRRTFGIPKVVQVRREQVRSMILLPDAPNCFS